MILYDRTCKFASQWIEAIDSEFQSHEQNNPWSLVQLPMLNRNILNTKWLFTVKISGDGQERSRARLVVVGCSYKNSYENTETYSPVYQSM